MDPSYLWKFPLLCYRAMVRRLGAKVVLIGMGLATVAVVLFGWWESWHSLPF